MRIISGKLLKGIKINIPKSSNIKPTMCKVKESLFNILDNYIFYDKINVLDLFCGFGGITYEFLSKNVHFICCVDVNYKCICFIKKTIKKLQIKQKTNVIKSNVFSYVYNNTYKDYDIIFMDPPYNICIDKINKLIIFIIENKIIKSGNHNFVIFEHLYSNVKFIKTNPYYDFTKKYGTTCFSFFKKNY